MSYVQDPINSFWDSRWDQPEPRITFLKDKVKQLEESVQTLTSEVAMLNQTVKNQEEMIMRLSMNNTTLTMFSVGLIDLERVKSIHKMFLSNDPENHTVAQAALKELSEIYTKQL